MVLGGGLIQALSGPRHAASLLGLTGLFGGGSGSDLEFREYYSSGCGHCQALEPAWKDAAARYSGPVTFAMVLGGGLIQALSGPRHAASLLGLTGLFGGGSGSDLEFREYYSSGCGHCQALEPAWKDAAARYSGPVTFRQVQCADENWNPIPENSSLCEEVHAFPTLKLFSGGKEVATYEGDRSADSLVDFAKQHEKVVTQGVPAAMALVSPPLQLRPPQRAMCRGAAAGQRFL
eukprot:CAMPEP_0180597184 /NCGR_PEP_ID=MMETSP1037_2-20121125/22199_1 /TAXON_ID=632150 /ORGANISM="Azadinium spinosum, Strain 3D9" /LENGTH=233 /DNA_ID=CAMNT_0022615715 /DNA_START=26 /DNA_END=728 /DNA_ORIENTATION=-